MLEAAYFDGRSAQGHVVHVRREGAMLLVRGEGIERCESLTSLQVGTRLGRAPRTIRFADGALCEVHDGAALDALLRGTAHHSGWLSLAESNRRQVLLSLLLIVGMMTLLVARGIPAAAELLARAAPAAWNRALGQQTLSALDRHLLQPSQLQSLRRAALVREFTALHGADGQPLPAHLIFRSSRAMGPNAFALPDGTIVLFDSLVLLADNDQQLLAVLAHELGHIQRRHAMRLLAQSSAVGMLTAWWFGDLSGLMAGVPSALVQARYSREFETEADLDATALLRANGIAPARLVEILRKLEAARPVGDESAWSSLLDSHPALRERANRLDGQRTTQTAQ